MRIIAHSGAPEWGGAEIALTDLLAGLAGRGHEVTLFANRSVVMERAQAKGIATRQVHLGGDIALHDAVLLSRALRVERPDALLVGTFGKLWLAALGARMAGGPRVVVRVGLSTDTPSSAKYRFVLKRWVDQVVFVSDGMRKSYVERLPGAGGPLRHHLQRASTPGRAEERRRGPQGPGPSREWAPGGKRRATRVQEALRPPPGGHGVPAERCPPRHRWRGAPAGGPGSARGDAGAQGPGPLPGLLSGHRSRDGGPGRPGHHLRPGGHGGCDARGHVAGACP